MRTIDERVAALAEQLGDRVVITGRVDFETLRSLYADADLLVQPSLYEGVGLPPLGHGIAHRSSRYDIAAQRGDLRRRRGVSTPRSQGPSVGIDSEVLPR